MNSKSEVAVDTIVATTTDEQISIADAQKKHRRSLWNYVFVSIVVLLLVTVPYGVGRHQAIYNTSQVIYVLSNFAPRGWALLSWSVMVIVITSFSLAVIESAWWTWGTVSAVFFAIQQYLSGIALFRPNYWWGTKVIFGSSDVYANGINAGIQCAVWALGVFAVTYFIALIFIPKKSKLNVLTRSWVAFIVFFIVEIGGLMIAFFGGLI